MRVLREVGVAGQRPATAEAARQFRLALEDLGFTVAAALGLYTLVKILRTPGSL